MSPADPLAEHVPRLYRFALRLTGDRHRAEDLTQEAFARAWQQRHRLRDERSARVWLFRIAHNLWRDQLRRRAVQSEAASLDEVAVSIRSPSEAASQREELERALTALDSLPPRQREVLYLVAVEQLSLSDVSQVLDITVNAAKANLSIARKKMRELTRPVANSESEGPS